MKAVLSDVACHAAPGRNDMGCDSTTDFGTQKCPFQQATAVSPKLLELVPVTQTGLARTVLARHIPEISPSVNMLLPTTNYCTQDDFPSRPRPWPHEESRATCLYRMSSTKTQMRSPTTVRRLFEKEGGSPMLHPAIRQRP